MEEKPPFSLPCHAKNEPPSSNAVSTPLSNSTSLSSQLSLPSLPSLNSHTQPLPSEPFLIHQCIATLKGHSSYISTLAVHGESLFSGSSDQVIRLWSSPFDLHQPSTNIPSYVVADTKSPVKSLIVFGESLLISSHQDHKIRVWKIAQKEHRPQPYHRCWKIKAVLPTAKDRLRSFFLPENYVQVRRHKKCTWVHHVDAVSGLALSHDGSLLYSVSWDRTLKVWGTSNFKCMESIAKAHHDAINAITVSEDGYIYTGSADTMIKVWMKHPGEKKHSLVQTLERHKSAVNALALSADGSVLYSGACDRSVVVWERLDGGLMTATGALRGHGKAILCLAVAGDLVSSGSADRTVRVWSRGGDGCYSCLAVLQGHGGPVKSLAMVGAESYCGKRRDSTRGKSGSSCLIFSGGLDCDIKVWKLFVS